MSQINNGRINIKQPDISALFSMYEKNPVQQCITFRDPTLGTWENTILSNAFFSSENMTIIQNGIRAGVFKRSNGQYVIGPQDNEALYVIMRSIFLQHTRNILHNIPQQITELNKLVFNYCIPQLYSEAVGYMKYIDDVSSLPTPISYPTQVGYPDKQLEMKPFI